MNFNNTSGFNRLLRAAGAPPSASQTKAAIAGNSHINMQTPTNRPTNPATERSQTATQLFGGQNAAPPVMNSNIGNIDRDFPRVNDSTGRIFTQDIIETSQFPGVGFSRQEAFERGLTVKGPFNPDAINTPIDNNAPPLPPEAYQGKGVGKTVIKQEAGKDGTNIVTGKDLFNLDIIVDQTIIDGKIQSVRVDGGSGELDVLQKGRTSEGNQTLITNFRGLVQQVNDAKGGDNTIVYNNVDRVNIVANTEGKGLNSIGVFNSKFGASIKTQGDSKVISQGNQYADGYYDTNNGEKNFLDIVVKDTQMGRRNSQIADTDQLDYVRYDSTQAQNSSEFFLRGRAKSAEFHTRNGVADTIYVNEGMAVDYSSMDKFDTVVFRNDSGGTRTVLAETAQYDSTWFNKISSFKNKSMPSNFESQHKGESSYDQGATGPYFDSPQDRAFGSAQGYFNRLATTYPVSKTEPKPYDSGATNQGNTKHATSNSKPSFFQNILSNNSSHAEAPAKQKPDNTSWFSYFQ